MTAADTPNVRKRFAELAGRRAELAGMEKGEFRALLTNASPDELALVAEPTGPDSEAYARGLRRGVEGARR